MKSQFSRELKAMIEKEIEKDKVEKKQESSMNNYRQRVAKIEFENRALEEAVKESNYAKTNAAPAMSTLDPDSTTHSWQSGVHQSTQRFLNKLSSSQIDLQSISSTNKKRTETMLRLKQINNEKAERA
jgi:hypothetical protein